MELAVEKENEEAIFEFDPEYLDIKKHFTIMMFTVATTSMSDDTAYSDESLPNFDRNTIENILMCSANDEDDMRKLDQLYKKMH